MTKTNFNLIRNIAVDHEWKPSTNLESGHDPMTFIADLMSSPLHPKSLTIAFVITEMSIGCCKRKGRETP